MTDLQANNVAESAPRSDAELSNESALPAVFDLTLAVAHSLGLAPASVAAAMALFDGGATVPFVARYRKEATGGLDEVQLRNIGLRRAYLVELEERRAAVLASIVEQGKLTPQLEAQLRRAETKAHLEDLYAPYRPRRRTRAQAAREKGLTPLAEAILAQSADGNPTELALAYTDAARAAAGATEAHGLVTVDDVFAGARDIVADVVADTAAVRHFVRRLYLDTAELLSEVVPGKDAEPTKFELYYAFRERARAIPSHRILAIRRGEAEGVLRSNVVVNQDKLLAGVERLAKLRNDSPFAEQLRLAIADSARRLLAPAMENELRAEMKQFADGAAVDVFAENLRNLMLSPPLGGRPVIGIDPGLRTGCKCAAVDGTGKFVSTITIFPSQGDAQLVRAKAELLEFIKVHQPAAIAVGNGTGGRETEGMVRKLITEHKLTDLFVVAVNEAGASVYSASDIAREEFPDLDLTIRGAISIARRLQDPLSELVKIEPKAIGVGQYQHDVHQPLLTTRLDAVVEDGVNRVGVELGTASAQLLQYVAGIGPSLAKKIVAHREASGGIASRAALLEVSGLGPKAFEQAAGFLRVRGENPLDASAVHPERYELVARMAADLGVPLVELIGNATLAETIDVSRYISDDVGEFTVRDIVAELIRPGRDPRSEFVAPRFRDDVTTVDDLTIGMVLEGIVTNVTAFGAFVDIGVHQDGLVHVSQLSDRFVQDPGSSVKAGQRLTVRVLEIDKVRGRIALTARKDGAEREARGPRPGQERRVPRGPRGGAAPMQQPQQQPQQAAGRGRGPRSGWKPGDPTAAPATEVSAAAGVAPAGERQPRRDGNQDPRRNAGGPRPAGDRGPRPAGDRGPRPTNDRGPRPAGDRGPRPAGDRGPRPTNDRGPRPTNDRGPRPTNDRGPRRDDAPAPRPAPLPPGYGVAGFVNNPFAALVPTSGKKK